MMILSMTVISMMALTIVTLRMILIAVSVWTTV